MPDTNLLPRSALGSSVASGETKIEWMEKEEEDEDATAAAAPLPTLFPTIVKEKR